MGENKKAAVMIYPYFSLQEITCLTSCLTLWYERQIDVFASSETPVTSEDGFRVLPAKTFAQFHIDDYDCLILPGIINPLPALFDEKSIAFLRGLKGEDILIASISSSPLLLAKAGLLDDRKFTSGVFEEMLDYLDFVPKPNIVRKPIYRDQNLITAIGFAFLEFTVQTLRALGLDCDDNILQGVTREFTESELTFSMGEANFKEFLEEYQSYLK